jgi:hypothetical protein
LQYYDADIGNACAAAFGAGQSVEGGERSGRENAQKAAAGQRHRMPHYRTAYRAGV